jgi:hypothetical protein
MIVNPEDQARETIVSTLADEEDTDEQFNQISGEYEACLASAREVPEHAGFHLKQASVYKRWLEQNAMEALQNLKRLNYIAQEWIV